MSDLHVEADIVLLASEPVQPNLFERDPITVKGSDHLLQNRLRIACRGAVDVEGTSADLHAALLRLMLSATIGHIEDFLGHIRSLRKAGQVPLISSSFEIVAL